MNHRFTPKALCRTGLFAALIIVCTYIQIPLPTGVPLTLQTFALALAGFLLGPMYGTLAVLCYLLLGAAGLPVFSGFTGGLGRFAGPTGGFLWGFPFLAAGCGLGPGRPRRADTGGISHGVSRISPGETGLHVRQTGISRIRRDLRRILPGLAGLLLCHLLGTAWYACSAGLAFPAAALVVSLPFLPKDVASLILALFFARGLEKRGLG